MKKRIRPIRTVAAFLLAAMLTGALAEGVSAYSSSVGDSTSTTTTITNGESETTITHKEDTNQSYEPAPANDTGYVALGNTFITPSASAGQTVAMIIPIVNYNFCPITNVVVKPKVSNKVTEWPFVAGDLSYSQTVPAMSAYTYGADVNLTRADLLFTFQVRDDVLTGIYPLPFEITFLANGFAEAQSKTTITAYIKTTGKPGSGRLEDNLAVSKPRLIVTGFETNPKDINAGDTFDLTVHVQNTSSTNAVSNVLFDIQSDAETTVASGTSGTSGGTAQSTTYAAFLPTSGASSIYKSTIGTGETVDLNLEMSARADLAQKPYVLVINMTYDAAGKVDYTDKATVSVPVWQKSKFDTGEENVGTPELGVGTDGNLSFSIYNTGRTTLSNVWFKLKDDAVSCDPVFVGTITSGGTGYVDCTFTANKVNDGKIHAVIEYEDDRGQVTSTDKTFDVQVVEQMMDYNVVEDEPMMEEEGPLLPGWAIGLIIAAAAVTALLILISIIRKQKAKKLERELEEEELEEEQEGSEPEEKDEADSKGEESGTAPGDGEDETSDASKDTREG